MITQSKNSSTILLIQKSTNFKLAFLKEIDKHRVLCKYLENNALYQKNRKAIFYKCDLRDPNSFEMMSDKGSE